MWIVPLIAEQVLKREDRVLSVVPKLIHFAFIFPETLLLKAIMRRFSLDGMVIRADVCNALINILSKVSEDYVDVWGMECLRWIIGSRDLRITALSLEIFNVILRPLDAKSINCVGEAVKRFFYTKNCGELLHHFLVFLNNVFVGNEEFVLCYCKAILGWDRFWESPESVPLLMKCLEIEYSIAIVKPLLAHVEASDRIYHILKSLWEQSNDPELFMILLPLKRMRSGATESFAEISDSVIVKAIGHYGWIMSNGVSLALSDSIFAVSAEILSKRPNIGYVFGRIFGYALDYVSNSDGAVDFVCEFSAKNIEIERCVKEVDLTTELRMELDSLGNEEVNMVNVTDFEEIDSVRSVLRYGNKVEVLPFSNQRRMLEKSKINLQIGVVECENVNVCEFRPLKGPAVIKDGGGLFGPKCDPSFVLSFEKFLESGE
jgi:hypothetical protein